MNKFFFPRKLRIQLLFTICISITCVQDIHNFDSSTVPAAWHGWLHYQHDEPPTEQFPVPPNHTVLASSRDDNPYHNHFGLKQKDIPEGNTSVYRPVGYGHGNLYQKWGEKEV